MRFRRGLPLVVVLWAASCTTVPPSPPPAAVVAPEATTYQPALDAPRLLEALDRKLASGEKTAADLSTSDLTLYSNLLLTAGRWAEAEQALSLLETRTPVNKEVAWSLVLLTGARGENAAQDKRLAAFEKAYPGDLDAANLRAARLLAQGDRAGAKAAWTAIVAQSENLDALSGLTRLALDAKRVSEARGFVDRVVATAPQSDAAWALHAQVANVQERYLEARADLDRAVALAPNDPWHRLDRGKLEFLHLYDFNGAKGDLEEATTRLPDNVLAWEALAEVYEELERPRQAYDAWMKTLSLRPDYRFAYPSAAMLSFRYQDWEHAAQYAREAAKAYPAEYAFPFVESLSLRALGKTAAAQTVLEKARPRFVRGSTVDEMFRFLLTPGSDYYLNAALNLEKDDKIRLRLRFYQGCYYALIKSPLAAKAAFDEVGASELMKIPEIPAARDWLEHGL